MSVVAYFHQVTSGSIKGRGRERQEWLIQLANREGAWPKRPYFLVEGGRVQNRPGRIMRV